MNLRLIAALASYAVIATLAGYTLDGNFRLFIWILMGALALKSYAAHKANL